MDARDTVNVVEGDRYPLVPPIKWKVIPDGDGFRLESGKIE